MRNQLTHENRALLDELTNYHCERLLRYQANRKTSRSESPQETAGFLDLSRRDTERFSLLRAISGRLDAIRANAANLGAWQEGPRAVSFEEECHQTLTKRFGEPVHPGRIYIPSDILYRDLSVGVAGSGGYLAGTKNVSFIDQLRNRSVAFRMGAQRMPGQRESITVPKQSGGSTVTWLTNETSQAAESTPSFSQVASGPKTASVYTEMSEKFLRQSGPAGEAIVTNGLAADLAVGVDAAVVNGSGASGEPTGILNAGGVIAASGASLSYGTVVAAQRAIADGNALLNPATLGYATTPTVAEALKSRQRFTGTDSPVWRGAIHEGEIEGIRAMASRQIPTAAMIFGDWSTIVIPEWGVLAVEVNPFADFKVGIVGARALWSMDVILQHPKSFVAITSIT